MRFQKSVDHEPAQPLYPAMMLSLSSIKYMTALVNVPDISMELNFFSQKPLICICLRIIIRCIIHLVCHLRKAYRAIS